MLSTSTVLVVLYVLTGLFPLVFIGPIRREFDKPGATGLFITIVGVCLWGFLNAAHTLAPTELFGNVFWNLRILVTVVTVLGWFLTVAEHVGLCRPTKRVIATLGVLPAISQGFVWTNTRHHLHYGPETTFTAVESIVTNYGPVFYVNVSYLYLLAVVALFLLVPEITGRRRLRRLQSIALFISSLPVIASNLVHLTVLPQADLTSFGFVAAVAIVGWALFYAQFLEVVPVARDRLVRTMSDPMVTLDTENRVVDSNPAARELCGVSEEGSLGMSAQEFFESFPGLVDRLGQAKQMRTEISIKEGGRERHFDLEVSPIESSDDQEVGRLVVFRDITERKEREKQLESTNERLDQFASFVTHDLRNPLQVASGRTELLRETGDLDHATEIERSLERMEGMIEDLRVLTSAGENQLDLMALDLSTVVRDSWEGISVGETELRVADEGTLVADRDLLMHIFENLFRNCVEHGSTGNRTQSGDSVEHGSTDNRTQSADSVEHGRDGTESLTVTVGCLPDHSGFYVEDDGVGIPSEERDSIFEYGYSDSSDGTGFGLSIVETIADAHGWSVRAGESETGGARFEFTGVDCEVTES